MGGWSSSPGDSITAIPVPVEQGGTEAATLTDGGVLLGSGTDAVTPMAVLADGAIIVGDGTTDPVSLAAFSSSTGDLTLAAGGTAASLTAVNGAIVYCGAAAMALSPAGSSGQLLRSAGAASPTWTTTTYPTTNAINTLLYASAADTMAALPTAASGVLVTGAGAGVPSISTDIPTAVTVGGAYIYRVSGTDVAVADGGTGGSVAGITLFNNITGFTAAGSTGTTSTNLVFSTSPTLVTPTLGVASATSINFGGTALANYVEGTFTPTVTLTGGAGNTVPVYTTNTGRYTRIGNRVFFNIELTGDGGNEGAGTGRVTIALPVTSNASAATLEILTGLGVNGATRYQLMIEIGASATTLQLYYFNAINTVADFTGVDQNNTSRSIYLTGVYEA